MPKGNSVYTLQLGIEKICVGHEHAFIFTCTNEEQFRQYVGMIALIILVSQPTI